MPTSSSRFALFLFAYYGYAGSFATYASLFFAARGMSGAEVGILMSLIQVMRIVGPNLWGWVADSTARHIRVLRGLCLAATLAFAGIALGGSFGQLFAAMLLLNLFTSAQAPLAEAMMLAEMRGDLTHYGRLRLWGSLGFIVAVMAAAYGLDRLGVDSLPWIAGSLLLCVTAASFVLREDAHPAVHQAAPGLWQVLRQPAVIAFFASTALMVAAHTSLYVYYSLYLERSGYSKAVIGAMWSLGVVAEIVFFYFQAAVFRRITPARLMLLSFAVGLLRFTAIGALASSLAILVLAQLLHALSFGAHHSSAMLMMQRWFHGPLQARGQALYISLAYGIGGSGGGLLMSLCWDGLGAHLIYFVAAGLCVAAALAAALSLRWQRHG